MTLQALEKKVSRIRIEPEMNRVYEFLVERFPPREIRSASEHRAYRELAQTLLRELGPDTDQRSAEGIRRYLGVLAPLIVNYERSRWPQARISGHEVLSYLMEQNGLNQADLGEEIGAQPYVSDILRGKKELTSGQIARLSKKFGVSPSVFFP